MLEKVNLIKFNTHVDDRDSLTVIQGQDDIPFEIKRIFYLSQVAKNSIRGGHAHKETDQVIVALAGSLRIIVNDGIVAKQAVLSIPNQGVFLPRMTWSVLVDFSPGTICMVLANTNYESQEYIRDWVDYLAIRNLPYIEEFTGPIYPMVP